MLLCCYTVFSAVLVSSYAHRVVEVIQFIGVVLNRAVNLRP